MINTLNDLKQFENKCLFPALPTIPARHQAPRSAEPQSDKNQRLQELIKRYKINRNQIDNVDERIKEAEEHRSHEAYNTGGWQRADERVFDLYDERKQIFKNRTLIEEQAEKLGYDISSFLKLTRN